jgi:hypothetical protein
LTIEYISIKIIDIKNITIMNNINTFTFFKKYQNITIKKIT